MDPKPMSTEPKALEKSSAETPEKKDEQFAEESSLDTKKKKGSSLADNPRYHNVTKPGRATVIIGGVAKSQEPPTKS
jgi:hypothetical protein